MKDFKSPDKRAVLLDMDLPSRRRQWWSIDFYLLFRRGVWLFLQVILVLVLFILFVRLLTVYEQLFQPRSYKKFFVLQAYHSVRCDFSFPFFSCLCPCIHTIARVLISLAMIIVLLKWKVLSKALWRLSYRL